MSQPSYFTSLLRLGLTNSNTSYSDVVGHDRSDYQAFCTSQLCAGAHTKVKKNIINKSRVYCPDCGSALYYKKTNNNE